MAGADVLMSQTIPTLVGMHVVSKSTDTLFGKSRRKDTRTTRTTRTTRAVKPRPHAGKRKVHTGERGGRYVMKRGRRVYI